MGLKQDIVVVNEYTLKQKNGKGSRGSTPGDYVMRYMARDLATETLEPIRRDNFVDYTLRYMARGDAVDVATDRDELKQMMYDAQGDGGVSFGYGDVSLSHDALHRSAKDIQRLFDEGHTVLKTVISFSEEYLERMGIVRDDFTLERDGDYRGNIDQMKLRMAIMQGLSRMNSLHYDDLRYIAVIQVDTGNVHCHLAMVDAGKGTIALDGRQKGKVSQRAIMSLRRSLDSYLDEKQTVPHMSAAISYDRKNVVTYVKKWAHKQILRETLPQFLLACLPEDRKLWRYGTNNKAMKKPNRIVKDLVEDVLSKPGSPMSSAMVKVQGYANHRRTTEGLSTAEWQRLIDNGREQIIERAANSVYGLLREVPKQMLTVRTPLLQAMSSDREQLAAIAASKVKNKSDDDVVGFAYRLRSYGSRLRHHNEQREVWREKAAEWRRWRETTSDLDPSELDTNWEPPSKVLYDFYVEEEQWHAKCAAKYRHFLNFVPPSSTWYEGWDAIENYADRLMSLEAMRHDGSLLRMKDTAEAERIGLDVYGQPGGAAIASGGDARESVDRRIDLMREAWSNKVDDLRVKMAAEGLLLNVKELSARDSELVDLREASEPGRQGRRRNRRASRPAGPPVGRFDPTVTQGPEFSFESVKGLDMHHLRWDFGQDAAVGPKTLSSFVSQQQRRTALLDRALEYLDKSGQMGAAGELPVHDVELMEATAKDVQGKGVLVSTVARLRREGAELRRTRTVETSVRLAETIEQDIATSVSRTPIDMDLETELPESAFTIQMREIQRAQDRLGNEDRSL